MEQTWLTKKLSEAKPSSTVALVMSEDTVKAQGASLIGAAFESEDFQADLALLKTCWFYHASSKKRCLLLVHEVKGDKPLSFQKAMIASAKKAVAELQTKKIMEVEFIFDSALKGLKESVGNFVTSFDHANYQRILKRVDAEEKKESDPRAKVHTKNVKNYVVHLEDASILESTEYKFQLASAHATLTAKNLCRERGSVADPAFMASEAQKIAASDKNGLIKEVAILKGKELVEQGMNLFYGVGQGAAIEPVCVMIHYQGNKDSTDVDFAIVGKGVTYDTGGLHIKQAMMESMYIDKGGSCAVLGALQGCLDLGLKKNVVFACGFAENAIGADAYKPNDILTAMNGLTVDIANTDAEGRLVLSDTMTCVQRKFNPKKVGYIATLTGASIVSLGKNTGAIFSGEDDKGESMVEAFKNASKDAHEPMWPMPLNDEHRESIKGKYSNDISNMGATRWGGACHAAAFLERFIEDERPWVHLDIAGPAMFGPSENGDATGFGAKLLLSYIDKCL